MCVNTRNITCNSGSNAKYNLLWLVTKLYNFIVINDGSVFIYSPITSRSDGTERERHSPLKPVTPAPPSAPASSFSATSAHCSAPLNPIFGSLHVTLRSHALSRGTLPSFPGNLHGWTPLPCFDLELIYLDLKSTNFGPFMDHKYWSPWLQLNQFPLICHCCWSQLWVLPEDVCLAPGFVPNQSAHADETC